MTFLSSSKPTGDVTKTSKSLWQVARQWLPVVFVFAACIAMIARSEWDGLVNLYGRWMYEEEYDYGFLVAALVPIFLWGRRWQILELSSRTVWPGFLIVFLAQVCAIIGNLGESFFIQQFSFVLTLLGLLVVIFGTGPFWIFVPLITLLLLTLPLPYTLQAMLTIKLQLISTWIGSAVISLLGIPVFVEGNIVDLGQYKLQVAEACSGLRYLLPLTCIAFILAYLYKASLWKKALLVVSAIPLTIFVNSLRIAVTAVLVNNFGIAMAEGFFHWFEGWVIFCLAAFLLAIEVLILEKFQVARITIEPVFLGRSAASTNTKSAPALHVSAIATILVCVAALGVSSVINTARGTVSKPEREAFALFPRQIDGWAGKPTYLDTATLQTLKASDYYVGDFSKERTPNVNLFIAYYDSLARGEAIHSPRVCLPGSGWEFATFEEKSFSTLIPGMTGTYNRVVIQKGLDKMLMYYWFQQRERLTANEFSMKYYLLADSLTKSRKDGSLVRMLTPIQNGTEKGEAEADERLKAFIESTVPKLGAYLPQ